jgi:hypothetical protein
VISDADVDSVVSLIQPRERYEAPVVTVNVKQVSVSGNDAEGQSVVRVTVASFHLTYDPAREGVHAGADVDGEIARVWGINTVVHHLDRDDGV